MSHIYKKHLPWTTVVHFTYTSTNSSGELWVVYMSHIYYKHLPWTVVVHFTNTSPTYSTVVSSGWSICLTFITNTYHGQWWSILRTHLLQIIVVSSRWSICLTFITNTYHGQWWSILCTHLLHILQWWALGGLYVSHL